MTLVEVVVAVVVLEVGLLGVVGTLVLAARALGEAVALERTVGALEGVYDSLAAGGAAGTGSGVHVAGGRIEWSVSASGAVAVEHRRDDGRVIGVYGSAWRPPSPR